MCYPLSFFGLVLFLGVNFEACSVCSCLMSESRKKNKEGCSLVVVYAKLHLLSKYIFPLLP